MWNRTTTAKDPLAGKIASHPNHLLSGSLECGTCGGAIGLVSGKGGGSYGCLNASRRAGEHEVLIARKRLEDKFASALNEWVFDPKLLDEIYEQNATKVKELSAHVPRELRLEKLELNRAETRVHNFIEFIVSGRATPRLADALSQAEAQVKSLLADIQSMRFGRAAGERGAPRRARQSRARMRQNGALPTGPRHVRRDASCGKQLGCLAWTGHRACSGLVRHFGALSASWAGPQSRNCRSTTTAAWALLRQHTARRVPSFEEQDSMMRCQSAKWCRAARVGVSLAFVALGQVGDAAALSLVCGDEDEPYHEDRALQVRPMHQGRLSNIESPLSGDVEVALNARIWGGFHSGEVRLVGPEGEVESERHYLPLGGLTSGGDGLPLLTPREPLLPDTQYRVDAEYDWGEGLEPEQHSWQFTTGTRVDLEPPPLPLIVTETGSSDVRLDLTFEGILVGEPEPSPGTAESLAELLMPLGFEHGEWPRDPADPLLRWITQRSTIFLGSHSCGWPLGRRSSARFGVFDGAGNFSGWTSVTELALPAAPPGVEPGPDDLSSAFPPAEQSAAQERDAGPSACSLHGGSSQRRGWAWWPGALLALAISRRAARAPQLLTPTPFQPKPISRLRIG